MSKKYIYDVINNEIKNFINYDNNLIETIKDSEKKKSCNEQIISENRLMDELHLYSVIMSNDDFCNTEDCIDEDDHIDFNNCTKPKLKK